MAVEELQPLQVVTNFDSEKQTYYLFIGYHTRACNTDVKLSHEHTTYLWVTKEEFLPLDSAEFLQTLVNQL